MNSSAKIADPNASPDQNAAGLLEGVPDPLRYDVEHPPDPDEVHGIVASMLPAGAKVLDVGCGSGVLAKVLEDASGAEFLGIEPDATRAARAVARGLKVRVGYLTAETVREIGLFDIVLFADVLEHLPNPQSMLLVARQALKPGGAVIVSVPNVAHWSVRLCLVRGLFQYQIEGIMDATHLRWFTADSIRALLVSSGFRVVEYRATAGQWLLDNWGRAPLRWLPARGRVRFLRTASKRWPTLFGAQHVLKAVML
jgi:methionine biosynthesis protein MetW